MQRGKKRYSNLCSEFFRVGEKKLPNKNTTPNVID